METKVEAFLARHQLMTNHAVIIVGVSGGPDSMALLHFLHKRSEAYDFQLIAVSVDHQLRGLDAQADVAYVQRICEKWQIVFESVQVDVKAYKQAHRVGTQVAARALRYEAFANIMRQYNANCLALGHHGDDQIETMVMGMMQKTNLQGLKGIPYRRPFANGEIVRPFLAVTKAEIEAYCKANGIRYRVDASNEDRSYTRNDLRHRVVPVLKEKNNQLHQTVQQLSETIQEDEQYLSQQAKKLVHDAVTFSKKNTAATISIKSFMAHSVSLQRRAFRLTLDYLYKLTIPEKLSYTHEQIFLALLADNTSNKVIHFPHKLLIERSYDMIHLYFKQGTVANEDFHEIIPTLPASIVLPNEQLLSIKEVEELPEDKKQSELFVYPKAKLPFPLHIRNRRQGDRMTYKGLHGSKKVKDILMDEKVPRYKRDQVYIITDNDDDILWLIGLRKKALPPESNGPYILCEYVKSINKGEKHDA